MEGRYPCFLFEMKLYLNRSVYIMISKYCINLKWGIDMSELKNLKGKLLVEQVEEDL